MRLKRALRQPALHEYSIFAFKMRLPEDPKDPITGDKQTGNIYTVGFPLAVCSPFGGDFDGDTVAMFLVPRENEEEITEKLSPRYVNVYKKSNTPIFVPNHETLNGLAVASEAKPDDPKELGDPRHYYEDYTQLLKDVEIEKKIKIGTPIVFTGEINGEKYQNKKTTYGRLRLSKIIGADIDKIGIFKAPYERISSKSGALLYQFLYDRPDGVEVINELQKFALRVVTAAGVVTFNYKTLYTDSNIDTYKDLVKIAEDSSLTDKQKLLLMTEKYKEYSKDLQSQYSDGLKNELSLANRVKLTSLIDMSGSQMIVSGVDEKPIINRGSLLSGLTEKDYQYHSVENRSLQSIKHSATPSGGYLVVHSKSHRMLERLN